MSNTQNAAAESAAVREKTNQEALKKIVFTGVFAAITFVVFTYLSIPIPTVGGGKVTVHLGNAFVVLGALILGSMYGGVGGALGLTIADLIDPMYIAQSPLTFAVKLVMGIIVGLIAHKAGHISTQTDRKKILFWVIVAVVVGMAYNSVVDPVARYFYKLLILGKPAATLSLSINVVVTLINSVVSAVLTVVLYMALRAPLKKLGMLFEI
jgi:uncharacterized membrane protein